METERAKAPVDFTTLQLHNLVYEKSHYLKAIKACKDFKSKYPDIELVPEEEFFRDAPKDIKDSVLSKDSAHNLMLKRLNFELYQVIIRYFDLKFKFYQVYLAFRN
jgi:THO complex subunit 5